MPKITYIEHDGVEHCVDVPSGYTVMQGARDNGVDGIVAECGGGLACATCHVYVKPPWGDRIPDPADDESAMIEFAEEPTEESRLSCQIEVSDALDGLVVHVPESQA